MKEGLDVYIPLVDDMGIDAIVRQRTVLDDLLKFK